MPLPRFDGDGDALVVTGGMVWIEPPKGLVTGGNYTANEEWSPSAVYYTSAGISAPQPDEPLMPFFHGDPDNDGSADGSCEGILPDECIEYIENAAEMDYINTGSSSQMIEDEEKCPGMSGASKLNLGSPLSFKRRDQNGAGYGVLRGWMRADEEGLDVSEKPDGKTSSLMCVAVNRVTEGKELLDPGQDYLEAVKDKEDGKSSAFGYA